MQDLPEHFELLKELQGHLNRHHAKVFLRLMNRDGVSDPEIEQSASHLAHALEGCAKRLRGARKEISYGGSDADRQAAEGFMAGHETKE
jgi:hypothetical protein